MRFFYHCFSRLSRHEENEENNTERVKSEWYKDLCLETLRGILEYGFLLKPEDKELIVHSDESEFGELATQTLEQSRCSFTLSEADKLQLPYPKLGKSHRDLFGDIAIAVPLQVGKALGMHPCLYSHDRISLEEPTRGHVSGEVSLSMSVNAQFTQVTDILRILAVIESASRDVQPEDVLDEIRPLGALTREMFEIRNLPEDDAKALLKEVKSLEPEQARYVIDFTDIVRESMYDLAGKMEILQSLFQSISAASRGVPLHYYDQQEWRLVRSISSSTVVSCLDLERDPYNVRGHYNRKYSTKARAHILEVAQLRNRGIRKEIDFSKYWINWGLLFDQNDAENILNIFCLIDHIICPGSWLDDVKELVCDIGKRRGLRRESSLKIFEWESNRDSDS